MIVKTPDREWLKKRLVLSVVCVFVAFTILIIRLVYLQIIEGDEYRRLSQNNCIRLNSIEASRGLIYDRNGVLLVDNRPSFDLTIILKDAAPVDDTLAALSGYTGIPLEELLEKTQPQHRISIYKPILLKKDISRDMLAVVEAHSFDLPGIMVAVESRRNYIYEKSAAHLIGYLGEINCDELASGLYPGVKGGDSIGKDGAEKVFEDQLRGKRGGRQVEVDASGRLVRVLQTVNPVPGMNVFLTLDKDLQATAEKMLEGKVGALVALDPMNGDVLTMVSSPSFDQNDFIGGISSEKWKALISDPARPMTNKAIQGEYPPASTFKILSALAGLEENAIDTKTSWFCSGALKYGNREYRCWKKWGHGDVSIVNALEESCDVFFYHVGEILGVDTLAQYARGCGLGRVTGIELGNERPGLVPTSAWKKRRFGVPWQGGETLSVVIGQGFNLVTPLQMAVFISAVGNNGTLYKPRILKSVNAPGDDVLMTRPPEISGGLPAGRETLKIIQHGLLKVVESESGTARQIRIKGVEIAGKTGTAQVFSSKKKDRGDDKRLDYHLRDHAWFVCYAPADNPVIAVAVIIEHGEHGSTAAAPVAVEVVRKCLQQKGLLTSE
ncbi:MAG: penicillin-binding protein 2 [Pseudomonadota bacterium]